jgi:aquaporin Z
MEPVLKRAQEIPFGRALRTHWPEYFCEAVGLGLFMISACVFGVLLDHPMSPIYNGIESAVVRRVIAGLAMGSTAVAIIVSRFGRRSGAHLNPAITLNYFLLGKIARWDALFYVLAQFIGGIGGVWAGHLLIGSPLEHSSVRYVITQPGPQGEGLAFLAEMLIAAFMMLMILVVSNTPRLSRFTPWFAGALIAVYITLEAPLSGMSMNPARTLGSAFLAGEWRALWLYFAAPPLGMFIAATIYRGVAGVGNVFCAKLHHHNSERCIFQCSFVALRAAKE